MSRIGYGMLTILWGCALLGPFVPASRAEDAPARAEAAPAAPAAKKPMKANEPMAGEMKKPGMTKGDVKKAARKKDKVMEPMMEKEEKEMKK